MKNNRTYTHYYGLDFLRGISGYGVAVCHYFAFIYQNSFSEYLSFIFVEFFFILSGFVLFPQLLKVLENKNNLLIFYQRRWIRTLPLYFVCLLLISFIFNKVFTLDFYKYFFFYTRHNSKFFKWCLLSYSLVIIYRGVFLFNFSINSYFIKR